MQKVLTILSFIARYAATGRDAVSLLRGSADALEDGRPVTDSLLEEKTAAVEERGAGIQSVDLSE